MNYVALGIIAEVDNLFNDVLNDKAHNIIKSVNKWEPIIVYEDYDDKKEEKQTSWNKCCYGVYWFLTFMHNTFYFYYFAVLAIALNFLLGYNVCQEPFTGVRQTFNSDPSGAGTLEMNPECVPTYF